MFLGSADHLTRNSVSQPTASVRAVQSGGRNPTIRRFLASIQPPLDDITPILVQGGVRDKACLDSLTAMTEVQQRAMLERLPLTVFQVQLICNALEERGAQDSN